LENFWKLLALANLENCHLVSVSDHHTVVAVAVVVAAGDGIQVPKIEFDTIAADGIVVAAVEKKKEEEERSDVKLYVSLVMIYLHVVFHLVLITMIY
jgi:hypothetical protein